MTPQDMALIHGASFTTPRPWTTDEFAALLAQRGTEAITRPDGFALIRILAPETELLTLAVAPGGRRKGTGRALMTEVLARADTAGAPQVFLEVAEDNAAARALYSALGFSITGRRKGYYRPDRTSRIDALVMARSPQAS